LQRRQLRRTKFPVVLANVVNASSQKPIFNPYSILPKKFNATTPDGTSMEAECRYHGLCATADYGMGSKISGWQSHGQRSVETANKYIPEMRTKGADLVVALSHGGLDASAYSPKMENASCI
jgi:2',3'-cyclic-nucleotide 2'-phosphodiesterase/3'-nucleotidase